MKIIIIIIVLLFSSLAFALSTPSPAILGNPTNFTINCVGATSANLLINYSALIINASMVEYSPSKWTYNQTTTGLNNTSFNYSFECCIGALCNRTILYSDIMVLPPMKLNLTLNDAVAPNTFIPILFNTTSTSGYNFDARSVYLYISPNFTFFFNTQNITFPTIDSFNSSQTGTWGLTSPANKGTYTVYYETRDVWGNVLRSPDYILEVDDGNIGFNFVALIILAFAFIYISTEEGASDV
jgi:hypothetical protein